MKNHAKRSILSAGLLSLFAAGAAHSQVMQYRVPWQSFASTSNERGALAATGFNRVFAPQQLNNRDEVRSLTLTNQGSRKLVVSAVSLAEGDGSFSSKSACDNKLLLPGQSCLVTLTFRATGTAGVKEAVLNVTHDGSGVKELALTGEGVYPSVAIPAELQFGPSPVGEPTTEVLTVHNDGLGAIGMGGASVLGGGSFAVADTSCSTALTANANCGYTVRFTPTGTAEAAGTLVVSTGAGIRNVNLRGSGLLGAFTLSPTSISAPPAQATQSSTSNAVTLTNTGSYAVANLRLATAAPFTVASSSCGTELQAGSACSFKVNFSPTVAQTYTGSVTVTGSRGLSSAVTVQGQGTLPSVVVPASLAFNPTPLATASVKTLTVTNDGLGPLAVTGATVQAGPAYTVGATTCAAPLASNASCSYDIAFKPTGVEAATGTLQVNTSAGAKTVALSGTGLVGTLIASPEAYPELAVLVGGSVTAPAITLQNSGSYAVEGLQFAVPAPFAITGSTCGMSLAMGASCAVTVKFSPVAAQPYAEVLTVTGSRGEKRLIPLTGIGQAPAPVRDTLADASYTIGLNSGSGSTVTVRNAGNSPMTIQSLAVTNKVGNFTAAFSGSCTVGATITPGGTCTVWTAISSGAKNSVHSGKVSVTTSAGVVDFTRSFNVVDVDVQYVPLNPSRNATSLIYEVYVSNPTNVPFEIFNFDRGPVFGGTAPQFGVLGDETYIKWGNSNCGGAVTSERQCIIRFWSTTAATGNRAYSTTLRILGGFHKTDSGVQVAKLPASNTQFMNNTTTISWYLYP